jgi:hypothetical protein
VPFISLQAGIYIWIGLSVDVIKGKKREEKEKMGSEQVK